MGDSIYRIMKKDLYHKGPFSIQINSYFITLAFCCCSVDYITSIECLSCLIFLHGKICNYISMKDLILVIQPLFICGSKASSFSIKTVFLAVPGARRFDGNLKEKEEELCSITLWNESRLPLYTTKRVSLISLC